MRPPGGARHPACAGSFRRRCEDPLSADRSPDWLRVGKRGHCLDAKFVLQETAAGRCVEMKILFALNHLGFYRNFQGTIERLCGQGCQVHLVLAKGHKSIRIDDFDPERGGERFRPLSCAVSGTTGGRRRCSA